MIIDFGSQTTHLISRRIGELGVKSKIVIPEEAIKEIEMVKPKGIIFSGGPSFVNKKEAPIISKKVFKLGFPILGICYGQQLMAYLLRGKVKDEIKKEYGQAELYIENSSLFKNIPQNHFQVWMSHGDEVVTLQKGT